MNLSEVFVLLPTTRFNALEDEIYAHLIQLVKYVQKSQVLRKHKSSRDVLLTKDMMFVIFNYRNKVLQYI